MPVLVMKGQMKNKAKIVTYIGNLCKELGINRMYSKVIFLNFKTNIEDDAQGLCWGDMKKGYCEISISRTEEGERLPFEQMMQTIAHEMVHAKQYFRGELNSYGSRVWKGRNAEGWKYENQPWEREAFRLEEKLYKKCWPKINEK